MLSITAQDYTTDRIAKKEEQYSGRMEVYVEEERLKSLKRKESNRNIFIKWEKIKIVIRSCRR